MKSTGATAIFGRRKEPHTVIIAHGDEIRHFTIRPWVAAFCGSGLAAIAIGYLLATSYLVLRDDLIGAATARQARLQQAYEDRISALRGQVDRITSRQMLDQQLMETKVSELMQRQSVLSQRHGRLGPILDRAGDLPDSAPAPQPKPDTRADAMPADSHGPSDSPRIATLAFAPESAKPFSFWATRTDAAPGGSPADRADKVFGEINKSLRTIESQQIDRISTLAEDAYQTADAISDALTSAGLNADGSGGKDAMGGPLLPVANPAGFDSKVKELDEALDKLERIKSEARRLPLANPAPGRPISSTFGIRSDPLLGTPALHSGMDFRVPMGADAHVTAPGTVTKAGWNGGYGRMVEVSHGNGLSTRYAHLSRILVKEGDKVNVGDVVGRTGSSGRSTGPHLHYEVRRNGDAVDPLRFLKAGRKISQYL